MRPFFLLIQSSFKFQKKQLPVIGTRLVLLLILICIFHQFWQIVKDGNSATAQINPVDFIWYLMIGALLQYSRPEGLHYQIEQEIKTGNIAYKMLRPISVISIYFFSGLGSFLFRLPLLFIVSALFLLVLKGGELPQTFDAVPVIFLLLLLSGIFISLCTVFIGLSTLWLQDSLPLFWILQKAEYILGGLFFPITLYPQWLQEIALATPFGWIGYGVSRLIYDYTPQAAFETGIHILFWIIILLIFNHISYTFLRKRIAINGG